jgi:hypothetical protein
MPRNRIRKKPTYGNRRKFAGSPRKLRVYGGRENRNDERWKKDAK